MQLLPGVGPSSAQRVLDLMTQADPLGALSDIPAPPRAGDGWDAFVQTLQTIRSGKAGWPAEIGHARRWYDPHLERIHEDAAVRQADLLQLEQIAAAVNLKLGGIDSGRLVRCGIDRTAGLRSQSKLRFGPNCAVT
jgi:DNA helicase-2/ATP-dependent DNA helicase PcrA